LDRGVSDLEQAGLYLRTRYEDPHRHEVRIREYAEDGRVWVVVNDKRSLWSTFDIDTVAAARQAVLDAGLDLLADVAPSGHDLATMTYEWRIGGDTGRFVDASYPAVIPEAVDRLEETLLLLEEEATGRS
jgi:hypothetical protein